MTQSVLPVRVRKEDSKFGTKTKTVSFHLDLYKKNPSFNQDIWNS